YAAEDRRGHPHGARMHLDRRAARAAHLQSASVRHRRVRARAHFERHRRERRLADRPGGPEQLQPETAWILPPLVGSHLGRWPRSSPSLCVLAAMLFISVGPALLAPSLPPPLRFEPPPPVLLTTWPCRPAACGELRGSPRNSIPALLDP